MRIGEKRKLIKRIKRMVLLPALIALVLIVIGEIGARKAGKSESGTAGESLTAVTEQTQNAEGQDSDGKDPGAGAGEDGAEEEAGAGEAAGTGEAGTGEAAGPGSGDAGENGTESPAEILTEPMQKIAFRAADSGGESPGIQRSVPVQIDSSILGGEAGTTCWAVFLPAEMEGHTAILLSGYKSVTMAELEEGEYLSDVRLGPASGDSEKEKTDTIGSEGTSGEEEKAHTYSSGDELYGLDNGSAFSVTLEEEDGSEYSDILYVFSCNDTATMYLDTESGSMETVDGDLTKNTSENAKFVIFMPDGSADCEGECAVSGRGNSTWGMKKRPYNVDFTEKKSVFGMTACKKLCLLADTFDQTNLLDRISSQIALDLGMRDTPQGEFVNLYLNGQYNGLYFLSQRPRTGGCVNIDKMDKRIREANGIDSSGDTNLPEKKALHEEGERLKKWAYDWPKEPLDNTGGYLLQQYSRYEGDDCWFSTMHRRYRIMSPSYPTVGQVNYISDYMLSAERAIYSEDGRDPESGKHYSEYLDLESWQDMFLLEEFFVEWDAERWSFYVIKDRKDDLLHCGPMWDFDHSAGTMLYGTYPETAVSTLMLRDSRHGWMNRLLTHDEFTRELHERWRERFSPAVRSFLDQRMEDEIAAIESSAYMNNIHRVNDTDYREDAETLMTWLQRRADFLDAYAGDGKADGSGAGADRYCRVLYQFSWGDLSHYVVRGEKLGSLPLPEYGETQIPSQIEENEIIGWQDEDGNSVSADTVIDQDCIYTPVYRQ